MNFIKNSQEINTKVYMLLLAMRILLLKGTIKKIIIFYTVKTYFLVLLKKKYINFLIIDLIIAIK